MREMKDSGVPWIGEIPKDWSITQLKNCITCFDGKRVPVDSSLRESGPYPYWGAGSITDWVNNYLFDEELVLLGEDGAPFFDPFRPVAHLVSGKIWVNNHIHVLKPHDAIDSRYLVYWLNIVDFHDYINGSILNKLTQSNMNIIRVSLPSFSEQHRIADFLDTKCTEIDAILEKTKASIEEYKKLKQSVITEAVTKGIRGEQPMKNSGVEWIGEIPSKSSIIKLGMLIKDYKAGPFGSSLITGNLLSEGSILVYTPEHIAKARTDIDNNLYLQEDRLDEMSQFVVSSGDIVFPIVGSLGRAMRITELMPKGIINQRLSKFRLREDKIDPSYFMWVFGKSSFYSTYIELNQRGAIIVNLTKEIVRNMPIVLHSISEQQEITAYLDEKCAAIDALIASKESLITELESYKKSLIYEYVTGKKEV